jgi:PHS family inorganic phosphate transporter-like MFS transporter
MLGYVYGKNRVLNKQQDLGVKIATPVGTLCGQLLFGWLADVVGRKKMCRSTPYRRRFLMLQLLTEFPPMLDGIELMIIIVATFAQALSANGHAIHIIGVLVIWRFIVSTHLPLLHNQPYDFHL